jgi:hypothetical protein
MKTLILNFCLLFAVISAAAQVRECGTPGTPEQEFMNYPWYGNNIILHRLVDSVHQYGFPVSQRNERVTEFERDSLFYIPVLARVFRNTDGSGIAYTLEEIEQIISIVNRNFRNNDVRLRLYIPCNMAYFVNHSLYTDINTGWMETQILWDYHTHGYLNIHFVRNIEGALGYVQTGIRKGAMTIRMIEGVGVRDVERTAGTVTHELGHLLKLEHTFANRGGSGNNRDTGPCKQEYVWRGKLLSWSCILHPEAFAAEVNGDFIADTEADPGIFVTGLPAFVDENDCSFITNVDGNNFPVPTDHSGAAWQPNLRNMMANASRCRDRTPFFSRGQTGVIYHSLFNYNLPFWFMRAIGPDRYEPDNFRLTATDINPNIFERQHHTLHQRCDEDWIRFRGTGLKVIETRAPFGITDAAQLADTYIELYRLNPATGVLELLAEDDNGGIGNFSKIEILLTGLENEDYFVRVRTLTPSLTTPLHYLIGVFNEFALWGDESAGGAGNSGSGGIDIGSIGGGGFGASGSMPVVCPNSTLNIVGIPSHPWISVTWTVNNAMVYTNPVSVFSAFISDAGYSGPLTITANVYYSGILIGSIIRDVWYGVPPASELFGPVTPRINPIRNWNIPIACQSDGLYFQAEYPTAVNYNSTTLQYQWEFTHSNNVPWTTIPPLPPFSLYTARNELLTNSLPVGRYWVRVRSRNECGWSAWSATAPLDGNEFLVLPTTDKECGNELIPPGGRKESPEKEKTYTIYPNPTKNGLNIRLDNENSAIISLYDKFGILKATTATEDGNAHLDLSNLAQDLYILKIQTPDAVFTEQVVKE